LTAVELISTPINGGALGANSPTLFPLPTRPYERKMRLNIRY